MADTDEAEVKGGDAGLDKLRRRHRRDKRAAYGRGLMQGILSMLRPGDVCIDCGANRGDVTAALAEVGAEVHAFEPDPYNLDRLRQRFELNARVHIHPEAVGVAAGTLRLMRAANWESDPDRASVKSTLVSGGRNIAEGEGIEVAVIDFPAFLRDLVARHGEIALLKLDIEGAELGLLNALHAQGGLEPVRLTLAETHERKFKELRPAFAALRETLGSAYPATKVNLDWI
jgi:FkbM family methyltransferase